MKVRAKSSQTQNEATFPMPAADALLRDVFGFDAFRPGQAEIVEAVAAGRNVLAIMPTGGGKSLCFQLPAMLRDGVTVVISPLIALMRDQVRALQEAGVEAGALTHRLRKSASPTSKASLSRKATLVEGCEKASRLAVLRVVAPPPGNCSPA